MHDGPEDFKEPLPSVRKSWNPMGGTRLYAVVRYRPISATSHTCSSGSKFVGSRAVVTTSQLIVVFILYIRQFIRLSESRRGRI